MQNEGVQINKERLGMKLPTMLWVTHSPADAMKVRKFVCDFCFMGCPRYSHISGLLHPVKRMDLPWRNMDFPFFMYRLVAPRCT